MTMIKVETPAERPITEDVLRVIRKIVPDKLDALAVTAIALAQLTVDAGVSPMEVIGSYTESLNAILDHEDGRAKG